MRIFPKNKKAVEPITIGLIIIGIIASLYIANQIGLFAVYTDPTLLKDTNINPSINRYFYDTAVPAGTNWECVKQQSVNFRTTDLSYAQGNIEYSSSCSSSLNIYSRGTGSSVSNCVGSFGTPILTNLPKSWTSGSTTFNTHSGGGDGILDLFSSGGLIICEDDMDGSGAIARRYDANGQTSNSISIDPSREIACGEAPIQDSGKFTCEGGNVVNKFCVYNSATVFPSVTQDTCTSSLPCEYVQRTINSVVKDVVKCSGNYKPNLNICSSDTKQLHSTNNLGFLTTTTCGVNNYSYCSSGVCAVCKHGTSWCEGSKVMSCNSNVISQTDNCIQEGFSCLQTGIAPTYTAPDTSASCSSSIPDGNKICDGNQQLIYSLAQRRYNNGTLCRTSCSSGVCTNEALCTDSAAVKCDIGALYKCDVSTAGNQWKYYYNNIFADSTCLSGQCNTDNKTCAKRMTPIQYIEGYEYCSSTNTKQRQKIIIDSSANALRSGGTEIADITGGLCTNNCVWNNLTYTTSCQLLSQCIGNVGLKVCNGNLLQQCDATGESITSTVDCTTQYDGGRGTCDATANPKVCKDNAGVCDGTFMCRDNQNIWSCLYGNWDGTTPQHTCEFGCTGTTSATSICNNQEGCTTGGTKCVNGTRYDCVAKTVTGTTKTYYTKSNSFACPTNTCNTAGTACSGQCVANTNACRVGTGFNQIYTCTSDGLWPTGSASETCSNKGCSVTTTDTPTLTNSQCTNDCDSSLKLCSGSILKKCNERTGVLDQDGKQWIFDNSQDVACIAGCSNSACNPQKSFTGNYCDGVNLMNSYTNSSNIAGGGISTKLVATCTLACQGSNGAASCKPIMAIGKYCTGSEGKVVNEVVADSNAIADGGVRIVQNVQTCELGCSNGVCITNCGGTSECSATDGKVHYCSNVGVLGAVTINCSNGCTEVNGEGKCNPFQTIGLYCKDSTNLWEAYSDPNNIEDGGVSLRSIVTCNVLNSVGGCTNGPPATCKPIHTLGYYCGGLEGKVLMQAVSNTALNNLANGFVTINTIRTCGLSCRQNTSTVPTTASCETNCDGSTECSNGVVKICDVNKELGSTSLQCTSGCTEVNGEGKCSPIHTLGKFCGTGINADKLMEAVPDSTATLDGGVKINTIATCVAGCTATTDGAVCARYKQPGEYCDGTKLMLAEIDTANSQASIPYGGIITSLVQQCPASCNQITTSAPTQAECVLDCAPGQTIACRPNGVWSCTSSGLYGSLIDECKDSSGISLGCSETTNRCKDECPVKTMDMCKLGDAYRCLGVEKTYTNISQLLLVKQESCTGGCEAGACIKQCTGDISCYPVTGNLHTCSSTGVRGDPVVVCKNGCDQTSNQCINECTPEGKVECVGADSRVCIKNVTNVNGRDYFQYVWKQTPCGANGCNPLNGLCTTECTPGVNKCATDGYIHSCNSDSTLSILPINTCNNKGCDINTNACNQQCSAIGFRCSGSNSIECYKNDTSNQLLERTVTCGILGCGSNGKCKSTGNPDSFICLGDNLHSTDSEGYPSTNAIKNCNLETLRNGLQPYCENGLNDCKVCSLGEYFCTPTELYQCGNIFTGEKSNTQICQVGCLNQNGNYYCDQLIDLVPSSQNFVIGTDVKVTGTLTRSKSHLGLILTNIKGTLSGGGQNNQIIAASDSNGKFDLNFGQNLPIGTYNVFVEVPDYNKTYSITVKVSNDYKVELAESVALIKYPGINPSASLKITGADSNPQDIIVLGTYSGISDIDISKDSTSGKWTINIQGDPGIYQINVSAVSNGVNQDIQAIPIEIRNPTLTITTNLPASSKPGKQEISVKVSGPTSKDQPSAGLVPDSITATLNNQPVELKNSGGGSYILENTFSLGTYTLQVDAQKEGYDSPTGGYSKSIQISSSGTIGGGGTGTGNQTSSCTLNSDCSSGYVCTNGQCTKSGFELNTTTLLIIGGVIVVGYFLLRKRRR